MMKRYFIFLLFLSFLAGPVFPVSTHTVDVVAVEAVQQVVYVTKTGKKYHKNNCRYLRQSKIKTTLSKAQESGYSACKVCKPK